MDPLVIYNIVFKKIYVVLLGCEDIYVIKIWSIMTFGDLLSICQ